MKNRETVLQVLVFNVIKPTLYAQKLSLDAPCKYRARN